MANTAWLAAPIAVVVLHRLAWTGGATTATPELLLLAGATFTVLVALGLIVRRLGVRSRALGFVLAVLFWASAPTFDLPASIGAAPTEPDKITLAPAAERRDLIVIMIDDYPSSQALLVDHGYDNAEFQLELSNLGFDIIPEAWSNASDPRLAIATTLSGEGQGGSQPEQRQLTAVLEGDNAIADLLREAGYATTHLGAPSTLSVWFRGPDRNSAASFDELADAIAAADGNDTPDFVFAHLRGCDPEEADALVEVVANTVCRNRRLVSALDRPGSGTNPTIDAIVAIAGTRGADIAGDLGDNPAAWPRSAVVRGLGVFSAVRLAPDCRPPPDDATVSVIVHHALACALDVDPNPPPEHAVVTSGDAVDPDRRLEVNLNVLRSDLSGRNLSKNE